LIPNLSGYIFLIGRSSCFDSVLRFQFVKICGAPSEITENHGWVGGIF
jgi:hypothetical protein